MGAGGGTDEHSTKFGCESVVGGYSRAGGAGGCSNVGIEMVQGGLPRLPEAEFEGTQCSRTRLLDIGIAGGGDSIGGKDMPRVLPRPSDSLLTDNSKGVEGETHPSLHASAKLAVGAILAVVCGDGVQQEEAVMPKDTMSAGNWKWERC